MVEPEEALGRALPDRPCHYIVRWLVSDDVAVPLTQGDDGDVDARKDGAVIRLHDLASAEWLVALAKRWLVPRAEQRARLTFDIFAVEGGVVGKIGALDLLREQSRLKAERHTLLAEVRELRRENRQLRWENEALGERANGTDG